MTNIEKAKALIKTFESGDANLAKSLLKENYIQHNLAYKTGREGFLESVNYLKNAPIKTTLRVIREFEDGDKVILHSVYNFAGSGEQVAFDVFRFEDGLIAEHWDNLTNLTKPNPSGHTQIDGTTNIIKNNNTEKTRELVKNFLHDVLQNKAPEKTLSYFDGDFYIQHNSTIADGLSGLGEALNNLAKAGIAMIYDKVHYVLACGDFVLGISEGSFGDKPTTYYDLFRVDNGKIAEHWDVMEEVLSKEIWANQNTKF